MPFTTIDPITALDGLSVAKFNAMIANMNDLHGRLSILETLGIVNFSFESDGDGDGVPDGWTKTSGTGGSITLVTTKTSQGSKAVKFSRSLGAGNNAGNLLSDKVVVTPGIGRFWFSYGCSAAVRSKIEALFYDKDESYLSAVTVSTLEMAASAIRGANPADVEIPAGARYMAVKISGATADVDLAGDAYVDAVMFSQTDVAAPKLLGSTYEATSVTTWETKETVRVPLHVLADTIGITVTIACSGMAPANMRLKIGATIGTAIGQKEANGDYEATITGLIAAGHAGTTVDVEIQVYKYNSNVPTWTTTSAYTSGIETKIRIAE